MDAIISLKTVVKALNAQNTHIYSKCFFFLSNLLHYSIPLSMSLACKI